MLQMVASGLSNRETGCRLGLTEGSVKWYMQQVFAKLDVRRHSSAVHRARQYGML
ncbi:MAG: response regulator transcription factor [Beijerinckiaceae bacterium]